MIRFRQGRSPQAEMGVKLEGQGVIGSTRRLETKDIVRLLLSLFPDAFAIYQFGSLGTTDERSESDLDLAILSPGPLDAVARWEAAQKIAQVAGRDVDLVDLWAVSTVMRLQVVAHGRRIYSADDNHVGAFEDRTFSAYARLNEERRSILEDVRQRGSVYAR